MSKDCIYTCVMIHPNCMPEELNTNYYEKCMYVL